MLVQYVEFSGASMDDEDELEDTDSNFDSASIRLPDPNADKANLKRGRPLENLLMTKNRRLQEQLTILRVIKFSAFLSNC